MTRAIRIWLILVIGVCVSIASADAQSKCITIQGVVPYNWPANVTAPVVVPFPADLFDARNLMTYVSVEGRGEPQQITAQYESADPIAGTPGRVWLQWAGSAEDRGKTMILRFEPGSSKPASPFSFTHADPQLHLTQAIGEPVLSFWHGQPEPGQKYPLTDFLHPIIGSEGETVTDVSPDDHFHHRGVFWAWHRYERQGKMIGSWWLPTNIHCEPGMIESSTGSVFARFHSLHYLVHREADSETGERFLREDVVCRVFEASEFGRAIDVEIMLAGLEKGVRIGGTTDGKKGYGGITFRNAPADYVRIEADGQFMPEDAIRHRAAKWADWSGMYKRPDGREGTKRSGAAILVHPSHPDIPTEWLLRHYGIINVSFPGMDMLEVPTDKPLRLRYRLWIHRGNASQGRVDAQYRAYSADWQWRMRDRGTER